MKKRNDYSPVRYTLYSFIVYAAACFFYRISFFDAVDADTLNSFRIFFYAFFVGSFILHTVSSISGHRNAASFLNILLSYEVITLILYFDKVKYIAAVAGVVFIALSGYFTYFIMTSEIGTDNPDKKDMIIESRIKYSASLCKKFMHVCFSVLLAAVIFINYISPALEVRKIEKFRSGEEYLSWTLEENYRRLEPLTSEKKWRKTPVEEKQEIVQTLCNIEVANLSIHFPVTVVPRLHEETGEDEDVLGSYNPDDRNITIYGLESRTAESILNTVAHECFHAAQFVYIDAFEGVSEKYRDLYFFRDVSSYEYEFSNYVDGSGDDADNYFDYLLQNCESDARDYAEKRAEYYKSEIDFYIWREEYEETREAQEETEAVEAEETSAADTENDSEE